MRSSARLRAGVISAEVSALSDFLGRPLTPVPPDVLAAIESGPIDPADALREDELDRLLDPALLKAEIGYCRLPDGVGYAAMRTKMPPGSPEMLEWWFAWHPVENIRYRIWHPVAHVANRVDPVVERAERSYWNVTHHPVEDVGVGVQHLRIEFRRPEDYGLPPDAEDRPGVARVVGGFVGDDRKRARHTRMTHVLLDDGATGGFVLRSRFWIGSVLRPYSPAPIASLVAKAINRPMARRALVPNAAPRALALHCAEEYHHLAAILPKIYAEFGPGA